MESKKLTAEESAKWRDFIGYCVVNNVTFPQNNKFNVIGSQSVQDLCALNATTLVDIAAKLSASQSGADPRFTTQKAAVVSGVKVADWLDFFDYTIRDKKYSLELKKKESELTQLEEFINETKTPEEKRREAQVKLDALKKDLETA